MSGWHMTWIMPAIFWQLVCSLTAMSQAQTSAAAPTAKWVGRATCGTATCHGGVVDSAALWHASATVWEARDPHAQAGLRLQETLARRIVIGLEPAAEKDAALFQQTLHQRCVSCHAPESESSPADSDWSRRMLQGVACESCHGAAGRWMDAHTRSDFNSRHESARALGMFDTKSMTARVENCARCHIGSRSADGLVRDVNHDLIAAGHPRMLFDPLVMQRKLPPHWDTRPGAAMTVAAPEANNVSQAARRIVLEYVSRLKQERRSPSDRLPSPEFSEFDCRACHRPLTSKGGA